MWTPVSCAIIGVSGGVEDIRGLKWLSGGPSYADV